MIFGAFTLVYETENGLFMERIEKKRRKTEREKTWSKEDFCGKRNRRGCCPESHVASYFMGMFADGPFGACRCRK